MPSLKVGAAVKRDFVILDDQLSFVAVFHYTVYGWMRFTVT